MEDFAYLNILAKMKMFKGIKKENILSLVEILDGKVKEYEAKDLVLKSASMNNYIGIVLEGVVQSISTTKDDEIIQRFSAGNSFLEAIALASLTSFSDIISFSKSKILFLDARLISKHKDNPDVTTLMANLLKELSKKLALMSFKNQLLSESRVRNRLLMYLNSLKEDKDGFRKVPFLQKDLASYLNVNKSAFNREIARMKEEGIIEVNGKNIKILRKIEDE